MNLKSLIYLDSSLKERARELAVRLTLNCFDASSASEDAKAQQAFIREQCLSRGDAFAFVLGKDGLTLHAINLEGTDLSIRADFHGATTTYRRKKGGGKSQMVARAVGIKGGVYPRVLDVTAGLGKDAFILASLGCEVTLLERVRVVYALLEDGMVQAQQHGLIWDPDLLKILDRMHLKEADAQNYLDKYYVRELPDVVYLDPMFPIRTKTAKVRKEMQVFHALVGPDKDADKLLECALKFALRRVVVKRPRKGTVLSGLNPSYSLEGKRNRYDVYTL